MKQALTIIFLMPLVIWTCGQGEGSETEPGVLPAVNMETGLDSLNYVPSTYLWKRYSNSKFGFSVEFPENWSVAEGLTGFNVPIISIYSTEFKSISRAPLSVHEAPEISHLSFFPKGFAVDGPSVVGVSLREAEAKIHVGIKLDSTNSVAYQLNNGKIWGYLLKPLVLPDGWTEEGFIFVQINVEDAQIKCFDPAGKEKPMNKCNLLGGSDRVIRYGQVNEKDRQIVRQMLSFLKFFDENNHDPMKNLIQVEQPLAYDSISSPLILLGQARGVWFHEGVFPILLKDENDKVLADGLAKAQADWQTSSWVPFSAKLTFDTLITDLKAILVLKRANPSGQSENEQFFSLPVVISRR